MVPPYRSKTADQASSREEVYARSFGLIGPDEVVSHIDHRGDRFYVIGRNGVVLAVLHENHQGDLVVVSGE